MVEFSKDSRTGEPSKDLIATLMLQDTADNASIGAADNASIDAADNASIDAVDNASIDATSNAPIPIL